MVTHTSTTRCGIPIGRKVSGRARLLESASGESQLLTLTLRRPRIQTRRSMRHIERCRKSWPISMDTFELEQIEKERARSGEAYLEFFRIPQMSLGVYKLE